MESLPALFPSIPRQELAPMLHELCLGGVGLGSPDQGMHRIKEENEEFWVRGW